MPMDARKHLIIIKGKDQTDSVASFQFRNGKCEVVYTSAPNGRVDNSTNVIFKAAERLSLDKSKPGAGVLPFDKKRVLTLEGATKATWAMNEVYDTQHIYGKRKNGAKDPIKGLYYAGIWQELGLMESDACTEWAKSILL